MSLTDAGERVWGLRSEMLNLAAAPLACLLFEVVPNAVLRAFQVDVVNLSGSAALLVSVWHTCLQLLFCAPVVMVTSKLLYLSHSICSDEQGYPIDGKFEIVLHRTTRPCSLHHSTCFVYAVCLLSVTMKEDRGPWICVQGCSCRRQNGRTLRRRFRV